MLFGTQGPATYVLRMVEVQLAAVTLAKVLIAIARSPTPPEQDQ